MNFHVGLCFCCKEVAKKSAHEFDGACDEPINSHGRVWAQFLVPKSQLPSWGFVSLHFHSSLDEPDTNFQHVMHSQQ